MEKQVNYTAGSHTEAVLFQIIICVYDGNMKWAKSFYVLRNISRTNETVR